MTFLSRNKMINVMTAATCAFIFLNIPLAQAGCCYDYPRQMKSNQTNHHHVVERQNDDRQPNYVFGQFNQPSHYNEFQSLEEPVSIPENYLKQYPWLGSNFDQVTYGPIAVSHIQLNKQKQVAIVKAGEIIKGSLNYSVNVDDQEIFHRYHLVVGIQDVGAQDCITHTYGIWNSNGKGDFTLKAPLKPGVYEVRFSLQEAKTCEAGRSMWNDEKGAPSSATIGAIIVE